MFKIHSYCNDNGCDCDDNGCHDSPEVRAQVPSCSLETEKWLTLTARRIQSFLKILKNRKESLSEIINAFADVYECFENQEPSDMLRCLNVFLSKQSEAYNADWNLFLKELIFTLSSEPDSFGENRDERFLWALALLKTGETFSDVLRNISGIIDLVLDFANEPKESNLDAPPQEQFNDPVDTW